MNVKGKQWRKDMALRLKCLKATDLAGQGVPLDAACRYAESEYKDTVQRIDTPSVAELQAQMDAKCKAAGVPDALIPGHVTEYKCGARTSTFEIDGRAVNYAEFRAHLTRNGINPARLERRITSPSRGERITTRDAVRVTPDAEA